jgi:flagellar biosynthesis protein FlhG
VLEGLVRNKKHTKTISITSGKGGVGKTTLTCNLAVHYAQQGNTVLILDGDLGMANVDVMFGRRARYSIMDVINGDKTIEEVLIQLQPGIFLIPGGSGLPELLHLSEVQKRHLLDEIGSLNGYFDYMLIDTAPGIDNNVLYLNSAVHEILVVLTPDPSSLTDSYALIKVLNMYQKEDRFSIVCNQVRHEEEALQIYKRLSEVAEKYLCVSLDYKGSVPTDLLQGRANRRQELVLDVCPMSPSATGIKNVAGQMAKWKDFDRVKGGLQFFWQQLLGVAS